MSFWTISRRSTPRRSSPEFGGKNLDLGRGASSLPHFKAVLLGSTKKDYQGPPAPMFVSTKWIDPPPNIEPPPGVDPLPLRTPVSRPGPDFPRPPIPSPPKPHIPLPPPDVLPPQPPPEVDPPTPPDIVPPPLPPPKRKPPGVVAGQSCVLL